MSDEPPGWDALFGDFPEDDDDERDDDAPPTPGERLLYAFGQLHRLHRRRRLPFHPRTFSVEDLARVLGVADELELVTEDHDGTSYHFAGEVLYVQPEQPFPWRLLTVWEWAAEQELNALWLKSRSEPEGSE